MSLETTQACKVPRRRLVVGLLLEKEEKVEGERSIEQSSPHIPNAALRHQAQRDTA